MTKARQGLEAARLNDIASTILNLDTLEARNSDSLDFHELSVWQIRNALKTAYAAGEADANRRAGRAA